MSPASDNARRFGFTAAQALIIILAAGWVYWPALRGGWLWDDNLYVTQNVALRSVAGLREIWLAPSGINYFPVADTVRWVQWHLWQANPLGYHLTNVVLHALGSLLVWRLLGRLGIGAAWLGGLIFAVHPVCVESVAWISELKNTLSLPPLLLAICAYWDYDERGRSGDYVRSVLWFLVAMLCKSTVAMLPVLLLVLAWWKRGRLRWSDGKAGSAFFAISLALGAVTIRFEHHRAIGAALAHGPGIISRLAGAGRAVMFYFLKCVWPVDLMPVYPRWGWDRVAAVDFWPWLVVAAVLAACWSRRTGWGRPALLGLLFFLLNLAPVLGVVPMAYQRISGVADHFAYLPLVGLIGLAMAGLDGLRRSAGGDARAVRLCFFAGIAALGGMLAVVSRRQAGIFRDEAALWTYAVQRNPDAWLARNNLGKVLLQGGRIAEATVQFEAALRLEPDSAEVCTNLGNALAQSGRAAEAVERYRQAIRIDPAFAGSHYDLGTALLYASRLGEAAEEFRAALRIDPGYAAAHNNLGLVLAKTGRLDEAVAHYEAALRLNPDFAEACLNLGNVLFNLERIPEAVAAYERALEINPRYAAAHQNLAYALRRLGRAAEAQVHSEAAARLGAGP